jgi:surfactin synthase thioesterase subunit
MPADSQPATDPPESWFEPIVTDKKNGTLLCFPFSGSGAAMFAGWKNHLIDDVNLLAAQLPGRESKIRQRPCEDLVATADAISASVAAGEFRDDKLFLAGFSLGALLAFEVARGLRRRGFGIELLIIGSSRAPQGRWARGALHKLPDKKFITKLQQQYSAIPQPVLDNAELLQLMLPMLRADIKMFETYRYQDDQPLACELLSLHGSSDSMVQPKHVYPWREMATFFRHRTFDGDHYFVRTHRESVLKTINGRIQRLI